MRSRGVGEAHERERLGDRALALGPWQVVEAGREARFSRPVSAPSADTSWGT